MGGSHPFSDHGWTASRCAGEPRSPWLVRTAIQHVRLMRTCSSGADQALRGRAVDLHRERLELTRGLIA